MNALTINPRDKIVTKETQIQTSTVRYDTAYVTNMERIFCVTHNVHFRIFNILANKCT